MMASTTQENNKDPPNTNALHFSHPHPLECTKSSLSESDKCFGCKLRFVDGDDEWYYNCRACSFCLHSVCYRMPLITKHPSHDPGHDLVLLLIPSSPATKATLRCTACGNHLTGFCYHCAECSSIFFHTFCLALPLSISLTHHPHALDLAFTPPYPYHFFCDLCSTHNNNNNSSSNGWLYRCSMCEFDTHIACALDNIHPSFPQSNAFMGKLLLHGTSSSMIMRLVARQIGCGGNRAQEQQQQQQHYCDDRKSLNKSPSRRRVQKRVVGIGKSKLIEMQETSAAAAAAAADLELEERTPLRDQSTPLSDTHTPSHQFSEAYFSIDLAKSYSAAPDTKKEDTIVGSDNDSKKNLSVVPAETIVVNNSHGGSAQGKKEETLFGVVNYLTANNININNNGLYSSNIIEKHQNKLNSAIFEGLGESNQKVLVKNSNEGGLPKRPSIKDQTVPKSESKRDNISSGWRKCLPCL